MINARLQVLQVFLRQGLIIKPTDGTVDVLDRGPQIGNEQASFSG